MWLGFNLFVVCMLALDLGVFNRKAHEVKIREALIWSAVWISLALLFAAGLYLFQDDDSDMAFLRNEHAALQFLTGYVIEESLSVDNLFVFILIFSYFKVQSKHQHRVLFWGILGALCMRAIFIFAGVWLIEKIHWIIYVFGAFLVYTGYKMLRKTDEEIDPENSFIIRLVRKLIPVKHDIESGKFFQIIDGKRHATTLFIVLVFVEFTDVVFAADSIPAILAISKDPFIVYTSNVFAIMGLRTLYFALSGLMQYFTYLQYGLAAVLIFVGGKMLAEAVHLEVPIGISLGVIAGILGLSILASLLNPKKIENPVHIAS